MIYLIVWSYLIETHIPSSHCYFVKRWIASYSYISPILAHAGSDGNFIL
jgi:hypothetical protein